MINSFRQRIDVKEVKQCYTGFTRILYGARQVGKTTLLENFLKTADFKYKLESGDNIRVKDIYNREKIEILKEIVESYLLRDILKLDKVRSPNVLMKLLKLLAFQVGSEVSMNELAMNVKVDVKTVARYLDLLEKSFVIIRLGGFSKNLRKEVVSMGKYYFLDNGIRNAVISQFNPLEDRNDTGEIIYLAPFYWFTIAHEIAHILLHLEKGTYFVDDLESLDTPLEKESDFAASRMLNVRAITDYFSGKYRYISESQVRQCGEQLNIAPAIIVGVLQYYKKLSRRNLNRFKHPVLGAIPGQYRVERKSIQLS